MQVLSAIVDDGLDPQSALDQPRFCIEPSEDGGWTSLEEGIDKKVIAALIKRGHPAKLVTGWERATFGRGQIIVRERSGVLIAGSDPRADGCAMTL